MRPTRTRVICSVVFLLLLAAVPARAEKVPGFPPQGRSIAGNQLGQTDSGFFTAQFKTAIAMSADRADKNGRSSLKPGSLYALFLHNPGSSGMGKFKAKFVEAKSRGHRGGAKSERQMGSEGSAASDAGRRPRPESEAVSANSVVPEPSTWLLLATGLLVLGILSWRRDPKRLRE